MKIGRNTTEGEGATQHATRTQARKARAPASLLMISGPLMRKKKAPVSLATARAISVLPVVDAHTCVSHAPTFGAHIRCDARKHPFRQVCTT